jgi:hypothetical protein
MAASLLTGGAGQALAQTEGGGDLKDAQLLIEKNRVLELAKANRNFDKMAKVERTGPAPEIKYDLPRYNFNLPGLAPVITPVAKVNSVSLPQFCNFLKVGVGNYGTIYGEGFYTTCKPGPFNFTVRAAHLSSMRGPVDGNNSGNHQTDVAAAGHYHTDGGKVTGQLAYQRNGLFFYGYNPEFRNRIRRRDIRQVYNLFDARVGYQTTDADQDLQYYGNLSFYTLFDAFRASESEFGIQGGGRANLSDESSFTLDANVSIARRNDLATFVNRQLMVFTPRYRFTLDRFKLGAGLNLVYDNDTIASNRSAFRAYPTLDLAYDLIENTFTAYASLEGNTQKVSLRRLVGENPFVGPGVPLAHTNQLWEVAGGLRGNLQGKFGFNVRGGLGSYRNLYFFVNSATDSTKFTTVYDGQAVAVANFLGELSYDNRGIRSVLKAEFFGYNTQDVAKPWHRPAVMASWLNGYRWKDKLLLSLDAYFIGGLRAFSQGSGRETPLDDIIDVNFKAEFRFTERLSAFAALNNIFSQSYQRYHYYGARQFNVLVGATFSF